MPRRPSAFALIVLIGAAAFALRLPGLASVPPRWDEGWSLAHAALPPGEILTVTAADVHPPLFYLALGAWRALAGPSLFAARLLGVLGGMLAIPLGFVAARAWGRGGPRVGVLAAAAMAWLPLAVYYSAVVRMYALVPAFLLLAAWGALSPGRRWAGVAFCLGALGAMLTLYHSVWALLGLGVYALLRARGRDRGRLLIWALLAACAYLPWAAYALPQLAGRAAAEGGNIGQQYPLTYFLEVAVMGLTLAGPLGWAGVLALAAVLVAGILATLPQARRVAQMLLPTLCVALTLLGISVAAKSWALNARMAIGAAPFLALGLGWALDALAARGRGLALAAAGAILLLFAPNALSVYAKTLEVFDPYDPGTYARHLAAQGRAGDIAFFNVLSPAGFYSLDGRADLPGWSYALTWDPVIEPTERWQARITSALKTHPRGWLVLYRGLAGHNGDLRGWMDSTFYPAHAEWGEEEVFYGLYGAANGPLRAVELPSQTRWGTLELRQAGLPVSVDVGAILPVDLTWVAVQAQTMNGRIFVHALAPDGRVVAQHDAAPLNDLRPLFTLPVGERVTDHHGLALPLDYRGELRVVVGVYDPATGQRLLLPDGRDSLTLGTLSTTGR